MAERKSKPRRAAKVDEDGEPVGWRKLAQNPWFILVSVIVIIILMVSGIFWLSGFLSGTN